MCGDRRAHRYLQYPIPNQSFASALCSLNLAKSRRIQSDPGRSIQSKCLRRSMAAASAPFGLFSRALLNPRATASRSQLGPRSVYLPLFPIVPRKNASCYSKSAFLGQRILDLHCYVAFCTFICLRICLLEQCPVNHD